MSRGELITPAGDSHVVTFSRLPWRDPVHLDNVPDNLTLAEMATLVDVPAEFWTRGAMFVDGHLMNRQYWHRIRPRGCVAVHLALPPAGGDGKNPLAIIASLALVVLTGGIAAGAVIPGLAAGSFAANLVAAGVGLVGQLVIKALFPPPVQKEPDTNERQLGVAANGDNVLERGAPIPRVVGTHRVAPPLAAYPRTYIENDDQIAEAIYCLAGPHAISDLRVGDTPIEDLNNVEYEIREGWSSDTPLTLVRYQTRQDRVDVTLPKHILRNDSDTDTAIADHIAAEKAIPQWIRCVSRKGPDQITFGFTYSAIIDADSSGKTQRLHLRWRARKRGTTTWTDLPEIRYVGRTSGRQRLEIRLFCYKAFPASTPDAPADDTFIGVDDTVPAVDVDCVVTKTGSPQWEADVTMEGAVHPRREGIDLYPEDSFFQDPDAVYEFEFKRSEMIQSDNWTLSNYFFPTTPTRHDPFDARFHSGSGEYRLRDSPKGKTGNEVVLNHITSHWYEKPVIGTDLCLIALKYRNQDLTNFSVLASGYVQDWDGVAFQKWTTTSNPAPHYRDVIAGALSADALPAARVKDSELVAWRAECATQGYECNAVLTGRTVQDARRLIAACGYAEPRQSEQWGVHYERDRSADPIRQVFTPRNTANFTASKAFTRRPRALRVTFLDEDNLFEDDEVTVADPNVDAVSISEPEAVEYPGLTTSAAVQVRAVYDMGQAFYRNIVYGFDEDIEFLTVQRGDLVALNHDVVQHQVGWSRVEEVDGRFITIDVDWDFLDVDGIFEVTDLFTRTDLFLLGKSSGIVARLSDQTVVTSTVSSYSSAARMLVLPAAIEGLAEGDLLAVGPVGNEYRRCLVQSIRPKGGLQARVNLVDEAPELLPGS